MFNREKVKFNIYVDGSSCHKKSLGGGTSYMMIKKSIVNNKEYIDYTSVRGYHIDSEVTNNQMELLGVLYALHNLHKSCESNGIDKSTLEIKIHSDSKYVVNIFNEYVKKWEVYGWVLAGQNLGEPVKNSDLIKNIQAIKKTFKNCVFVWVKGHNGNIENEVVDSVARFCRVNKKNYSKVFNELEELFLDNKDLIQKKKCFQKYT